MSVQTRRIAASLISQSLIVLVFAWFAFLAIEDQVFWEQGAHKFIGFAAIAMVISSITFGIIMHVIFAIGHTMVSKAPIQDFSDERDNVIELKSLRISFIVFGLILIGNMLALAIGRIDVELALIIVVLNLGATTIYSNISKVIFYVRGY